MEMRYFILLSVLLEASTGFAAPRGDINHRSNLGDQANLPFCQNLETKVQSTSLEQSFCTIPLGASTSSNEIAFVNTTSSFTKRHQRPERTSNEFGPNNDQSRRIWCYRDGQQPRQSDTQKLCSSIDNNWLLPRAVDIKEDGRLEFSHCICTQWSLGTASYRACNCDSCDSVVVGNLQDNCNAMNAKCPANGFASGYTSNTAEDSNFLTMLNGIRMMGDYMWEAFDYLSLNQLVKSTCGSGDRNRVGQDIEGPVDQPN